MVDNWKPYLCNVNGKLASILVNLGLRDEIPMPSKPWLLWIWVYFQTPRLDGLSDGNEAPTLYKIEDALDLSLSRVCQAIACGRITTEGRREFYFYGETKKDLRRAVKAALKDFEEYKYDVGSQEDSRWSQYLDVLYPSPEDLQRIANMDVINLMRGKGDVPTVAREVRHWIYFGSERARAQFGNAIIESGFRVISESISEGEMPFGLIVARTEPAEQESIDRTVIELLDLSRRFDGDYDGWETQLITQ